MAKKKETNENIGLVRQFDDMKKKHPDAMLLFRNSYAQGRGSPFATRWKTPS